MGMKDRVLLLILMYDPFHSCEVINTAIWFVGQLSFYENQRLTSGKSYNLNYSILQVHGFTQETDKLSITNALSQHSPRYEIYTCRYIHLGTQTFYGSS